MAAVARHGTDDVLTCDVRTPMAVSATSHPWGAAIDTLPLTSDYSDEVVLLGRLKPGRVRESRRVVHVFPLASGARHATTLTARCGERAGTGDLQWLPGLTGMPCEYCMLDSLTER